MVAHSSSNLKKKVIKLSLVLLLSLTYTGPFGNISNFHFLKVTSELFHLMLFSYFFFFFWKNKQLSFTTTSVIRSYFISENIWKFFVNWTDWEMNPTGLGRYASTTELKNLREKAEKGLLLNMKKNDNNYLQRNHANQQ